MLIFVSLSLTELVHILRRANLIGSSGSKLCLSFNFLYNVVGVTIITFKQEAASGLRVQSLSFKVSIGDEHDIRFSDFYRYRIPC